MLVTLVRYFAEFEEPLQEFAAQIEMVEVRWSLSERTILSVSQDREPLDPLAEKT